MRKTVSSVRQWNWPALLGWLVFALALTGFDQWTKNWIQHRLITGDVDRITDFFNLVVAYNSGAAFSFLADAGGWQRPLFAGLAIVVSLVICVIIARNSSRKFLCLGLALVLSGALGNAWDRFTIGVVVDFLDFHVGSYHWPAVPADVPHRHLRRPGCRLPDRKTERHPLLGFERFEPSPDFSTSARS